MCSIIDQWFFGDGKGIGKWGELLDGVGYWGALPAVTLLVSATGTKYEKPQSFGLGFSDRARRPWPEVIRTA
ncbi:hypothetical protein M5M_04800 [Simiduia agarivorans SA1 = DSM 21679]|uniref:Uncharacterized protein n=1 Tax=Simiduia agarivorans (strain DSM 21679 / JCM 13881 / BCRC 17597 / SA1) TaxID=1117647 RepID=K4KW92_SIMAS|nr:hypothetical protein M5M_04800 [Simiduia agarivorans SA1 = DSM 21679]